jgi:hypothetical protein
VNPESERVRAKWLAWCPTKWKLASTQTSGGRPGCGSPLGRASGGQQGREAPINRLSAVRPLGIHEEGGKAGRLGRPNRGGLEAWHRVVEGGPLAFIGIHWQVRAAQRGFAGRKGAGADPRMISAVAAAAKKAASASRGVVNRRPKPLERRGRESWATVGSRKDGRGRVLQQMEGSNDHLPFGRSNVRRELLPGVTRMRCVRRA